MSLLGFSLPRREPPDATCRDCGADFYSQWAWHDHEDNATCPNCDSTRITYHPPEEDRYDD
jgi:Zn finger protein HypA/HybF involved in hydrogenase expression